MRSESESARSQQSVGPRARMRTRTREQQKEQQIETGTETNNPNVRDHEMSEDQERESEHEIVRGERPLERARETKRVSERDRDERDCKRASRLLGRLKFCLTTEGKISYGRQ